MSPRGQRILSIDLVRGLAVVLMALDHTRSYLDNASRPMDLATTTAPLFFTRWITHVCAPAFMFLAGLGASLADKPKPELARFLVTRGAWLIILELTIVRACWLFTFDLDLVYLGVLWALGWSMIALALLLWLPRSALAIIACAAIAGHNAFDHVMLTGSLWQILHEPGELKLGSTTVLVDYPLIPWLFVMALGYCCAPVFRWEPSRRRRFLAGAGVGMVAAFVLVRALHAYGDPRPWSADNNALLSFLRITKYPPSLQYLLVTLGITFLLLALFERAGDQPLVVFGRTPLFFYLLHIPLIHAIAVAGHMLGGPRPGFPLGDRLPHADYPLWFVYVVWLAVVSVLYVLCRRYAELKRKHPSPWLSYL